MTPLYSQSLCVSMFNNILSTKPERSVNLLSWLTCDKFKSVVEQYRNSQFKNKKALPAITPSGVFKKRGVDGLIQPSGIICIDIDGKDNPEHNMEKLKLELSKLPYILVCMLSVSGKGLFCIIPYTNWQSHKEHFYALEKEFAEMGIVVDKGCNDISRLRVCSYDPIPYINLYAETYTKVLVKRTIQKVQREKPIMQTMNSRNQIVITQPMEWLSVENELLRPSNLDSVRLKPPISKTKEVQCILNYVIANEIDITAIYNDWFIIGNIVKSIYKNNGLEMFHKVSMFYPNYSKDETDNLYAHIETANYHYKYERIHEIAGRYLSNIAEILNG